MAEQDKAEDQAEEKETVHDRIDALGTGDGNFAADLKAVLHEMAGKKGSK